MTRTIITTLIAAALLLGFSAPTLRGIASQDDTLPFDNALVDKIIKLAREIQADPSFSFDTHAGVVSLTDKETTLLANRIVRPTRMLMIDCPQGVRGILSVKD